MDRGCHCLSLVIVIDKCDKMLNNKQLIRNVIAMINLFVSMQYIRNLFRLLKSLKCYLETYFLFIHILTICDIKFNINYSLHEMCDFTNADKDSIKIQGTFV